MSWPGSAYRASSGFFLKDTEFIQNEKRLYRLDTEQALFDAFFRCRRASLRFPYKRAWEQSPADCLNGHLLAGRLGGGELLKQFCRFGEPCASRECQQPEGSVRVVRDG